MQVCLQRPNHYLTTSAQPPREYPYVMAIIQIYYEINWKTHLKIMFTLAESSLDQAPMSLPVSDKQTPFSEIRFTLMKVNIDNKSTVDFYTGSGMIKMFLEKYNEDLGQEEKRD